VVAEGGTVQARIWTGAGTPGFVFPELRQPALGQMGEATLKTLQSKQNFAICLSGGGFRATSCALGYDLLEPLSNLFTDDEYFSK